MRTRSKIHLRPLTSVRFFAAFHVLVYHSSEWIDPIVPDGLGFLSHLLHTGYTGVNLFFVLSGFILAYTYLEPDQPARVDSRSFWWARFARIYPLYIVSLLVIGPKVVGHFLDTNAWHTALAKVVSSLAPAATLTHAWIPPVRAIWNSPGWTLSAEAFFYLCFPWLAVLVWKLPPRRAVWLAGASWLAGLLPTLVSFSFLPEATLATPASERMPESALSVLLRIAPIVRIPEFIFGMALARAFFPRAAAEDAALPVRFPTALALGSFAGLVLAISFADHIPRVLVHAGVLNPFYGGLIVGLAHCRGWLERVMSIRLLVLFGEVSYAIYILHIPIRLWLADWIGEEATLRMGPLFFLLYASLVLAISTLAFYGIEDPARGWLRRRWSARRPRTVPGAEVAR